MKLLINETNDYIWAAKFFAILGTKTSGTTFQIWKIKNVKKTHFFPKWYVSEYLLPKHINEQLQPSILAMTETETKTETENSPLSGCTRFSSRLISEAVKNKTTEVRTLAPL